MQHALILISLWIVVIFTAQPRIQEFKQWLSKVRKCFQHRRRLKSMLATFQMLYERASTDYLRGYYYGKIKMTEIELKGVWK